jgi:chromosome segregation protein
VFDGGLIENISNNINKLSDKSNNLLNKRDALNSTLGKDEERREKYLEEISTKTQELGELKSQMTAQRAKEEEEVKRKQRLDHEIKELTTQISVEKENIAQARARLQLALDSMAEDVGGRDELEKLREKAQQTVGKYKQKASNDKDLAYELALKEQSTQAQLQSTRETMDRMASQVQRSKERMESLTKQIEASDEPLER